MKQYFRAKHLSIGGSEERGPPSGGGPFGLLG